MAGGCFCKCAHTLGVAEGAVSKSEIWQLVDQAGGLAQALLQHHAVAAVQGHRGHRRRERVLGPGLPWWTPPMVRVVSLRTVRPPPRPRERVPLTSWDVAMLSTNYIQKGLLFHKRNDSSRAA